jgi:hypothetical protein
MGGFNTSLIDWEPTDNKTMHIWGRINGQRIFAGEILMYWNNSPDV